MKLRLFILMLVIQFLLISTVSAKTLIIVTDEWPPYEYNYGTQGIAVNLVKAIAQEEQISIQLKSTSWARGVELIKNKQIDGIFPIQKTKEREKFAYFMSEPFIISNDVLFYRKDRNYKKLKSLNGLTIGTVIGYYYVPKFWEDSKQSKIDNTASDSYQVLKKLLAGRIDMAIMDERAGKYILKRMGQLDKVDYISRGYRREYSMAFSKIPENKVYIEKFDKGLKRIKKNGKYKKILIANYD